MRRILFLNGLALLLAGSAVSLTGCGSGELATAPVTGKVTFHDKPLPGGGTISFVPAGEGKGAGGIIAEDGTYVLNTYGEGDGAILGEHQVLIQQNTTIKPAVWPEVPEGQEPPPGQKPISEAVMVPEEDRIPPVYSSPESPLTATVEGGTNEFNFDLKPQ